MKLYFQSEPSLGNGNATTEISFNLINCYEIKASSQICLRLECEYTAMGDHGFNFCLLHTVIAIWKGLLAERAGKLKWLEKQGN